ncbi:CPBP family intramembrane glutamic endopeptidase [Porcincola intestinalis]|uniref:CPBP family intramembrane glutamic endopeptidase n=1 Tax=Porcincola intestinalis TaxID=2606632 RepID=UPI0023F0AAA3|nr:CPBP family intramembrane glutamic endopeptidase [Porcincola intestinalis]MCI6767416.1 CPBP family intramembrane metalloprotease [Lachnospiraceae bacterium]MDD7060650.1 CPBP family intramembrane metalloprotease [Porcincola intestinalis]MDY5282962.1 CPBP family intramembrane glutamic endopeptidase [Porcincola intestinalis]
MDKNNPSAIFPILLWLLVSGIITAAFQAAAEKTGAFTDVDTAAAGAASALLIPAYVLMLRRWKLPAYPIERKRSLSRGPWLLAAGGAGAALSLLYGWLTAKLHLSEYFTDDVQQHFYSAPLWQQLIVLCMLTPVCEELLFRGLVFGSMRRKNSGWKAAVFTSVLFSVLHGSPIQMLYAFPMGLVLQAFLHMEGGLEAPILLHICANLASVLTEYILR